MPRPERSHRKQFAVLWEADGYDAYGRVQLGDRTQLKVRWTWTQSLTNSVNANQVVVDARAKLSRSVPTGSVMWLGKIAELPTGTSFDDSNPLMEVVSVSEATDVKGRVTGYTANLAFYKGVFPA